MDSGKSSIAPGWFASSTYFTHVYDADWTFLTNLRMDWCEREILDYFSVLHNKTLWSSWGDAFVLQWTNISQWWYLQSAQSRQLEVSKNEIEMIGAIRLTSKTIRLHLNWTRFITETLYWMLSHPNWFNWIIHTQGNELIISTYEHRNVT